MVKTMIASLEKTLSPLNNFLRNEYVTGVVALFVVLYASNVAPRLPNVVIDLFNNPIFRVFVLFLVAYVANKNPAVALLVSVAFVVTLNVINRQEAEEGFLDVIDTFNSDKKENFEAGNACDSIESKYDGESWGSVCRSEYDPDNKNPDTELLNDCCTCAASTTGGNLDNNCDENTQPGCSDFKKYCSPKNSEEGGEDDGEKKYVFNRS